MKTKAQLKAELTTHVSAARLSADKAEAEGRDFTEEERKSVEAHLGEARLLEKQIEALDPDETQKRKKESDEAMRDMILDLGKDLEGGNRGVGGKSGKWSQAFLQRFSGRKDFLTPSGSSGVPAMSETLPTSGERLETLLQALIPIPLGEDGKAGGSVEYLREVKREHHAVPVAAGAKKPTSIYELVEVNAPAEVIAHLTEPIPRRYLEDWGNLRRYIDDVLRQGLLLAVENQIVNGSGVSPQLQGMLQCAGITVLIPSTSIDPIILARQGQTILELQSMPTDGMIYAINPTTWETMETSRISVGAFEMNVEGGRQGAPINRALRQLWGCPVVPSVAVPATSILLWHRSAVQLYERRGATVDWSENVTELIDGSPVTDFEKNQMRFRAEGRWCLAVYKPSGIVEIVLDVS